jgi:hypothetical protein
VEGRTDAGGLERLASVISDAADLSTLNGWPEWYAA